MKETAAVSGSDQRHCKKHAEKKKSTKKERGDAQAWSGKLTI